MSVPNYFGHYSCVLWNFSRHLLQNSPNNISITRILISWKNLNVIFEGTSRYFFINLRPIVDEEGHWPKKVKSTTTREVNALCMSQSPGCFKKVKEGVILCKGREKD